MATACDPVSSLSSVLDHGDDLHCPYNVWVAWGLLFWRVEVTSVDVGLPRCAITIPARREMKNTGWTIAKCRYVVICSRLAVVYG